MTLQNLKPNANRNKKRKRIGRGNGSGHGTFATKGMKGQTARTGGRRRPGFEGGQMPLIRKMPKLGGFKCPNRVEYQVINVSDLNFFEENEIVNKESLLAKKLIRKKTMPIKLLGNGKLEKAVKIQLDKVSKSAAEKVTAAKGEILS
jgi:large subunit ribosomal protein L15